MTDGLRRPERCIMHKLTHELADAETYKHTQIPTNTHKHRRPSARSNRRNPQELTGELRADAETYKYPQHPQTPTNTCTSESEESKPAGRVFRQQILKAGSRFRT